MLGSSDICAKLAAVYYKVGTEAGPVFSKYDKLEYFAKLISSYGIATGLNLILLNWFRSSSNFKSDKICSEMQ
jgi:hypothetical protein